MPATPVLYFANALGRVYQHGTDYVRIEWLKAPMRPVELRAVHEHALNLLRLTRARKILTDHRHMAPYTPDDREWIIHDWVPRAIREAGYAYAAVVQAHDVFNRLSTRQITVALEKETLRVSYFEEEADALAWLLRQP